MLLYAFKSFKIYFSILQLYYISTVYLHENVACFNFVFSKFCADFPTIHTFSFFFFRQDIKFPNLNFSVYFKKLQSLRRLFSSPKVCIAKIYLYAFVFSKLSVQYFNLTVIEMVYFLGFLSSSTAVRSQATEYVV